tara:strand:- start:943 stop:1134 length:192 start_codon:yes stop_codon:yes gene_type:complete
MPWYDVEVHREQHFFTVEADSEEQAEIDALVMADDQSDWGTYTYISEISIAEMALRKETMGVD